MTRTRLFVTFMALVLGVALEAQTTQPSAATTLAIVGGTLIDGTGAAAKPDMTILVAGSRIEAIGPAARTAVPPGARVIRANGKFILPGFIDAHVHYRDYYPELLITHGITSVADWGGSPLEWVLAQRDGVSKGKIYGPRIYTSGEVIGETRGEAATAEAVTKQVRDLAARGVDRIDLGFDVSPELVKAIVQEAHRLGLSVSGYPLRAREAIEAGLDAFKHTHTLGRANTDAAGIAILTKNLAVGERFRDVHPCVLDGNADALMQLMLSHRTVWIPTLVKDFKAVLPRRDEFERDNIRLIGNPELGYLPVQDLLLQLTNTSDEGLMQTPCGDIGTFDTASPDYALFQRSYTQLLQFIGTFVKSGGRVLAGTAPHSFVLPGISLHHEMQLFVDAGLTPMQALQSASLWPAEWMRAQKDIGSVEAGKLADLVILTKNPLDDIRNTRSVETVMQGGRVLPTGYHRGYTNPIPRNTQRSAPSGGYARPELSRIAPLVVVEGAGDVALRVLGRQFARKSVVLFESTPIATEFVSETELKAVIPARLVATAGTYWLHVFTQRPGGGESTPASLVVAFK